MKTESKRLETCQVELSVTLDAEEMKAVVKDVEKGFLREAQIPGFRKGKVPLALIRKNFASGLKEETERTMVRQFCDKAIAAEKVESLAVTGVKDVKFGDEGGSFVALVDVKPEVTVPAYKGLKIAPANTKVEDGAVFDQIERIRAMHAKFEDAKDGDAAAAGDFVQIDYSGTVDGKPIAEIAPDAKVVAGGTGFWTQIEEGRFLPEILEAVKGMKAGETKEGVKATFDKESAPEGLKGANAEYKVTLKSFRRRILPNDAELVEKVKVESFEKLAADIREAMEKQAVTSEQNRRENEAVEQLLKDVSFAVPPVQVNRQMEAYLDDLFKRAQSAGISNEYFEQNRDKILADARANAERQVRLWYVIDAIAEAEKIECKPEEKGRKVLDLVLANAQ